LGIERGGERLVGGEQQAARGIGGAAAAPGGVIGSQAGKVRANGYAVLVHAVHPSREERPLTGTYQERGLPVGQVLVDRGDQAGVRGLLDAEPAQGTGAVAEVQVPGDVQALRQRAPDPPRV
ncbi:hypothetical protein, partial [Streptomyces sp. SID3212]|uniref:hypothetical protein n=1 Tax=Streptomyces sp. SID3212 TaxID=2690259 RepID=UPI001F33CDBB